MQKNKLWEMGKAARTASYALGAMNAAQKNNLLLSLATELENSLEEILACNDKDMALAKKAGIPASMLDRLMLDKARVLALASDVREVGKLHDPVGEVLDGSELSSGLSLMRKRVPLGVVATIYEARPNVTVDVAALCLKTGNAAILRGGKETRHSNEILIKIIQRCLEKNSLPSACVQSITDPDRSLVMELLHLHEFVDMLIPRGGAGLHKLCRENSHIPVITGGIGICHIFVDESAKFAESLKVIENSKIQRCSACNSLETAIIHRSIADKFINEMATYLTPKGVVFHATPEALPYFAKLGLPIAKVTEEELVQEWLSFDMNVHVVENLEEAIAFIRAHQGDHSNSILTENIQNAARFVQSIDAAAVFVNASTRFTDGGQFGLGAEVAVSTQKLHARGPLGLEALTTYKWIGQGNYTLRN